MTPNSAIEGTGGLAYGKVLRRTARERGRAEGATRVPLDPGGRYSRGTAPAATSGGSRDAVCRPVQRAPSAVRAIWGQWKGRSAKCVVMFEGWDHPAVLGAVMCARGASGGDPAGVERSERSGQRGPPAIGTVTIIRSFPR